MQKPYRLLLPVLLFFCIAGPKAAYPKIPAEPALQTEPERAVNVEGKDAALTERDFLFGDDRPFKQCHASTLVGLDDGNFLVAWFGGDKESADNVAIWLSKGKPGNWSAPRRSRENPRRRPLEPGAVPRREGKSLSFFQSGEKNNRMGDMVDDFVGRRNDLVETRRTRQRRPGRPGPCSQ